MSVSTVQAFTSRQEMLSLVPRAGKVAELGVFTGMFSADLLAQLDPAELHLIDRWDGICTCWDQNMTKLYRKDLDKVYWELKKQYEPDPRVRLHRDDSSTCLRRFPDGYFDFIYVDADHSYAGAKADIEVARHKTRLLGGHDYCQDWPGVIRAVDELVATGEWAWVSQTTGDRFPSYLLARV